jgi:hypothetical protein
MESMVVIKVRDKEWKTVSLSKRYLSPIAVCTVEYGGNGVGLLPAVVRMKDVGPNSFDISLQNPKNRESLENQGRDVHCVVVEEGSWDMPDGRKIEANKYESTVTDSTVSWLGEEQSSANSYTTPIVLGQVMSYNDEQWSVFWSRCSGQQEAPNSSNLFTGKHVGEDKIVTRKDEIIGYIVIEAGHATSTKPPTRQPTNRSTKPPTRQPTNRPTKSPTRQPTNRPTKHPTRQPTNKPTNETSDEATDK